MEKNITININYDTKEPLEDITNMIKNELVDELVDDVTKMIEKELSDKESKYQPSFGDIIDCLDGTYNDDYYKKLLTNIVLEYSNRQEYINAITNYLSVESNSLSKIKESSQRQKESIIDLMSPNFAEINKDKDIFQVPMIDLFGEIIRREVYGEIFKTIVINEGLFD